MTFAEIGHGNVLVDADVIAFWRDMLALWVKATKGHVNTCAASADVRYDHSSRIQYVVISCMRLSKAWLIIHCPARTLSMCAIVLLDGASEHACGRATAERASGATSGNPSIPLRRAERGPLAPDLTD